MKNTLDDEKLKGALTEDEKKTISDLTSEGLQWIEGNQNAEAEVIEGKQKEMEAKFNPIITRLTQATGGPSGMPSGMRMPASGAEEPATGADDLD